MARPSVLRFAFTAAAFLTLGCSIAPRGGGPVVGGAVHLPGQPTPVVGPLHIQAPDRMLVRRGDLSEVVEDLTPPLVRAHNLTSSLGGYIASESRDDRSVNVSLRVPEPKLNIALDSLSQLGTVTSRSVSSQDVTEESIDVEARLQSLMAERDQLRALLGHATAIGDVFTIDREIARVQGEIDSLQHRLEHLRSASALAELNAEFKKRREPGPVAAFFGAVGRGIGRLFVK